MTWMRKILGGATLSLAVVGGACLHAADDDGLLGPDKAVKPPAENPATQADPEQKKRASELEALLAELADLRPDLADFHQDEWVGYVTTAKETLDPFIKKYPGTEEMARASYRVWEIQKLAKQKKDKDYLFAAANVAQGQTEDSVKILLEGALGAAQEQDWESTDRYAAHLQKSNIPAQLQVQVFSFLADLALNHPIETVEAAQAAAKAALNYAEQTVKLDAEAGKLIAAKTADFANRVQDDALMMQAIKLCADSKNPQIQQFVSIVKEREKFLVGKEAPDFEATDINGKKIKLSDYRGKVVLLDFWASWCPPCRAEMPNMVDIQKKFAGPKFAILGISVDHKEAEMHDFMKKAGMTWRMIYDEAHDAEGKGVTDHFTVTSFPTTILIDEKGVIRAKYLRGEELQKAVEERIKTVPDATDKTGAAPQKEGLGG